MTGPPILPHAAAGHERPPGLARPPSWSDAGPPPDGAWCRCCWAGRFWTERLGQPRLALHDVPSTEPPVGGCGGGQAVSRALASAQQSPQGGQQLIEQCWRGSVARIGYRSALGLVGQCCAPECFTDRFRQGRAVIGCDHTATVAQRSAAAPTRTAATRDGTRVRLRAAPGPGRQGRAASGIDPWRRIIRQPDRCVYA